MDSMAKWNIIVDQFNAHKESKENEIQNLWENIFSQVFDYSKMLGFLDAQKSYHLRRIGLMQYVSDLFSLQIGDIFLSANCVRPRLGDFGRLF